MGEPPRTDLAVPPSLGDRMKHYEAQHQVYLDPTAPTVMRLDGHGFSKFTRAAFPTRPFSPLFHTAMLATCTDLLAAHPSITYAYTQSDEITLIFPTGVSAYNGRTDKLLSLTAAKASVRFNAHLRAAAAAAEDEKESAIAAEHLDIAHFDARIFTVPTHADLLNAVLWRARTDCRRNAVDKYARQHFGATELQGVNTGEKIARMKAERGWDYEVEAPAWVRFGTSVKRELVQRVGVNLKTGLEERTWRMRVRGEDLEWRGFSEEGVGRVVGKYW